MLSYRKMNCTMFFRLQGYTQCTLLHVKKHSVHQWCNVALCWSITSLLGVVTSATEMKFSSRRKVQQYSNLPWQTYCVILLEWALPLIHTHTYLPLPIPSPVKSEACRTSAGRVWNQADYGSGGLGLWKVFAWQEAFWVHARFWAHEREKHQQWRGDFFPNFSYSWD